MLLTTTTLLSQRADPSPLWFGIFPKRGIGRGITSIFRVLCDKAKRGCASHVPPSPGAPARRARGVLVEGATPLFWPLVRHRGGGGGAPEWSHHLPSPLGGHSLHSDPCGKAVEPMRKPRPRVEVVAMAWEQKHPDRPGRRLEFWAAGAKGRPPSKRLSCGRPSPMPIGRWSNAGGLDVVMEKIVQWGQETPAFNGAG